MDTANITGDATGQYLTFSLAGEQFGMEPCDRTAASVVIVVRIETACAAVTAGCLVDAVTDVVSLGADCVRPPPSACGTADSHYLSGVAMTDKQLIMLIDVVRLVESSVTMQAAGAAA